MGNDIKIKFIARLRKLVTNVGGVGKLADKANIPLSTMQKYLQGSAPTFEKLAAIAQAGNVSVDWLTTGKDYRETIPLNIRILCDITTEVEKIFDDYKVNMKPEKKAKLISNLYEEMIENGTTLDVIKKEITRLAEMME